ncbi:hypothetical protein BKA70DRAFT_380745 [Coprinopsis sp. MPI-PUGE-AT-0042]|nr:hypothetical protein BKA70DRAFT_380745 [Coprinopsis sp. MPI-PUGE-AT-0042]
MRIASLLSRNSPSPPPRSDEPEGSPNPQTPRRSSSVPLEEDDGLLSPPSTSRKRAREDFTDAAKQIARNVRFKPGSEEEASVVAFSKLSSFIQLVTIYARIHAMSLQLNRLTAPDTVWEIPPMLVHRIERCTYSVVISPVCGAYITRPGPTAAILEHLEQNPRWGLTPAVSNDKPKLDIVVRKIQKSLTTRRNTIKTLLKESLGSHEEDEEGQGNKSAWDILQLTQTILATGEGVMVGNAAVGVSLPMLARFAFLRQCMLEALKDKTCSFAKDFWPAIDFTLKQIREFKQTDIRISRFFTEILDEDIATYGDIDRSRLVDGVFDALQEQ